MKTAVQWLEEQINGNELFYIDDLFEQAKELEKQQIIDAHGDKLTKSGGTSNYEYWFTGEEYYNKTFKK